MERVFRSWMSARSAAKKWVVETPDIYNDSSGACPRITVHVGYLSDG
jgi:hypothetical protein